MEFIDKNTIKLDKHLNKLDEFVLRFLEVLEPNSNYVLVSGYVSILFGRSRMSEDIDIIIPKLPDLEKLNKDMETHGFICINTDEIKEMESLLTSGHSIRFSEAGKSIPNVELRLADNEFSRMAFSDRLTVVLGKHTLFISPLELQIAFKRVALGSQKDIEDALHLEIIFKSHLNSELLEEIKHAIKRQY